MREAAFRSLPEYLHEEKSANVSNELPDLDEDVSFVVDDGAPTGPIPLRTIINSIRSGERAPDVLVWWAGASEWEQFASNPSLFGLLQDLPATNQPPPPPDLDEETAVHEDPVRHEEADVHEDPVLHEETAVHEDAEFYEETAVDEGAWVDDVEVAEPGDKFPEPHVTTFDLSVNGSPVDESETEEDERKEAEPEEEHLDEEASVAAAADAEADLLLARDSRAMHPSTGWGLDESAAIESVATESVATELIATDFHLPQSDEPPADVSQETMAPEPVELDPSLTGLFSASARTDAGLSGDAATPAADEAATSGRVSLANVGARIDALTSATRRARRLDVDPLDEAQTIEPQPVTFEEPVEVDVGEPADVLTPAYEPRDQLEDLATEEEGEFLVAIETREPESDVESEEPAASAGSWQSVAEFSEPVETQEPAVALDDRFAEMVRKSLEHQRRLDWATRVEELLLSACITAIVDSGYLVLDSTSSDGVHLVLFDHNEDSRQVRLELSPLSPLNAAGDHVGRHVRVGLAWGQEVADGDAAFAIVRSEAIDGDVALGTFTSDVNMVANSASTSVALIWAADEFVRDDHSVDRASLDASIAAVLHAIEARWYELFEPTR